MNAEIGIEAAQFPERNSYIGFPLQWMIWPDVNTVDEELDVVHEGGDHGLPQLSLHLLLLDTDSFNQSVGKD